GVVTLGDALAQYRAQRPQREREAAPRTPDLPPQKAAAQSADEDDDRHRRWREELARKQKQEEEELARKKKQEAGLTEEETAEELENLLYRLELQKVSLETTGHQKHTLDDKAMGAEGQKNADDFVLPDVRSLIESLNQQNNRLESQFQGHLLRECDYEADSELLALEDKVEEASTEEQQPLNIQLVEDKHREVEHHHDAMTEHDELSPEHEEWHRVAPSKGDPEEQHDDAELHKARLRPCMDSDASWEVQQWQHLCKRRPESQCATVARRIGQPSMCTRAFLPRDALHFLPTVNSDQTPN
ncbi:unnamed protein product, partial [Prorocentrum cordatum]